MKTIPAAFLERALAWFIDRIVVIVIQAIILLLFFLITGSFVKFTENDPSSVLSALIFGFSLSISILILVSWFLYRYLTEIRMNGQTFGKKLLNLQVVKANGFAASEQDIFVRELVFVLLGAVPIINIIVFILNLILIAFSDKKQAIHDLIAKTMVVPS